MPEKIRQIPTEAGSFSVDEKVEDKDSKEKRSLSDRLKSRAKNYVKIALITVATLSPMSSDAAEGSVGMEGDKIENVQEDKELSEEEKSLLKEMQQLANAKAEQISKDYPEISIEDIDKFQQQAWDLAAFIVQHEGDLETYKFSLEQLVKDTFSQDQGSEEKKKEDAERELSDTEKSFLKEMQQSANQIVEQISKEFKDVSQEKLDKFQQMLWDFAGFIVQESGDMAAFQYGAKEFKNKRFAQEIAHVKADQLGEAEQKAELVAPEILEDSVEINAEWMWNNVDKIFRKGDTVLVVKSAKSRDMQMSVNKAEFMARSVLADLLKQAKGGSKDGLISEVLVHSRARNMDITGNGKLYYTVVVMEMPLSANIK